MNFTILGSVGYIVEPIGSILSAVITGKSMRRFVYNRNY